MVHFASFEERQRQIRPPVVAGEMIPVKLEIEDSLVDEHGPFNKKQKQSSSSDQVKSLFLI